MNEQELLAFFRDLHEYPELGNEEYRTTEKLLEALHALGIRTLDTGLETGAVAVIGGKRPGRVIGLRGDIDALPVRELSGLSYASKIPGRMHACGHDFHTATMLGAAALLKAREEELLGTVKVVFQPAEEISQGGNMMAATGLLDDADEFYGIHSYPWFEAGTLGIKEGPVMAAPDRFMIVVRGESTHGAQPHKGADPIPAASALVLAAQTLVSRGTDPFRPVVLSVTHFEAGNTWNVIPAEALLEGTVRTLNPDDRVRMRDALERTAENTAEAYGCAAEFTWSEGPAAVINDAGLCAAARQVALDMGFTVDRQEDTMDGEDFSEFTKRCPGVFVRVGTGGGYPIHHPRFTADPRALWPAANFFAKLAEERLSVSDGRKYRGEHTPNSI